MKVFGETVRNCKRCEYELDGGESICPKCQFSPRDRGLRISLGLLVVVVVSVTLMLFVPGLGRLLVRIAALSFLLAFLVFFVSFLATPYRLGSLFLRL